VQQQIQYQFLQSSTARSSALPFTRWIQTNAALRSHGGGGGAGGALPALLLLFFLSLLLPSQIMLVFFLFFCPLLMPSSLLFSSLLSGDLLFGFEHHHFTNYFTLDHNSFCDFISAP
jgi:hypothetical protein